MKITDKRTGLSGRNRLVSTLLVILILVLAQAVIFRINTGSFSGMLQKLLLAWLNILRNNTYAGIIALGMCFVIISGGIDLSVGSMLTALGAFLMYLIEPNTGLLQKLGIRGTPACILAVILVIILGWFLGSINGSLVAWGRIPPFIVTLGTMKIFRSVTQQLTKTFNPTVPEGFKQIASFRIGGQVILPLIYWLIAAAVVYVIFRKTAFGRHTVAVGSNERAARLSGLPVKQIRIRVYGLAGLLTAVATVIYVSRIGSMDFSNAGNGYEMDAIAAVAVGGTAMSGGRGSIIGAVLGMLIIGAMNNIMNSVGVPTFLCDAVKGVIIIAAVLLQKKED